MEMTRINLIAPQELFDQHLMAEYREMLMVPAALKRTLLSRRGFRRGDIPKAFTLGQGHVRFFYDKGKYLHERYKLLVRELKHRGFQLDSARIFPSELFIANNLYGNWRPSENDYKIIRRRIRQRISLKPDWYRKRTAIALSTHSK